MTTNADIVVAGAGHNSLIAAAYLARSGREVLILEEQDVLGGGAVTEELLAPGYRIDTCSTGHTLIQGNPLLVDDELGLRSEQGLTYVDPDPVALVVFPDGESLTMWLDVERTVAELARFSPADAEAYRRMLREWAEVRSVFRSDLFTPVGVGPSIDEALGATPSGRVWLRRRALSAWQVISHELTDPHVQAFACWQASQTLVALDAPGSGVLAYSLMAGRQARSWSIPRGGSGQLTDALVRVIEAAGGTALTGRRVAELIIDGGRCRGVRAADGEEFRAREAVLSTIHVRHLLGMAPRELWGEDFVYGVETFDPGLSAYVVYQHDGTAGVHHRGRHRIGRVRRLGGLARGRHRRDQEDPPWACRSGLPVGAGGDAQPGRRPAGAARPPHGQGAAPAVAPATAWADLGRGGARAHRPSARTPARRRAEHDPRRDHGLADPQPGRHRRRQRPHDQRHLPRRRPGHAVHGRAAAGTGLGAAPHADPRPLPDRRHHASRRVDHRRAGPQCGTGPARRPRHLDRGGHRRGPMSPPVALGHTHAR